MLISGDPLSQDPMDDKNQLKSIAVRTNCLEDTNINHLLPCDQEF